MLLIITVALVALVVGLIPFMVLNGDVKRTVGTSTLTNALLYRKLLNEDKLTRLQITAGRQKQTRDQNSEASEWRQRWQDGEKKFSRDIKRGWV